MLEALIDKYHLKLEKALNAQTNAEHNQDHEEILKASHQQEILSNIIDDLNKLKQRTSATECLSLGSNSIIL